MVNRKPRWYLVSSYRDKKTKRPRQHQIYLGPPPDDQMKQLIVSMNETFAENSKHYWDGKHLLRIRQLLHRQRNERKAERQRQKSRKRLGNGADLAPSIDQFTRFLSGTLSLKQKFMKCIRLTPLEKRSKRQLQHFLEDTKWIVEGREQAERLLQA